MKWLNLTCMALVIVLSSCTKNVKVVDIVDGDTIIVHPHTPIRIIGIDAPEIKQNSQKFLSDVQTNFSSPEKEFKIAIEGKNELSKLILNKTVKLETVEGFENEILENGRYGRALRFVYLGNTDIGLSMIKLGYARTWPAGIPHQGFTHKKEKEYLKEESVSKELANGIWGEGIVEKQE